LEENNSLEEYMQEKDRNRKLDGCVNTDLVGGNKFASDVIVTNKSHKYSSEAINELVKDVNSIIDRTFIDIAQAKFDINPKRVGNKDYGCEYCCFKDICYKTEKDYVDINVNKEDQDA
jgi:ATP-dependent helicase/DNAse subunit B